MGSVSELRPRSGLLDRLLDEPHTLATLAVAMRLCDHRPELRAPQKLEDGFMLYWCSICGAMGVQSAVDLEPQWQPPTIAQFIVARLAREHQAAMLTIREVAVTLRSTYLAAMDGGAGALASPEDLRRVQELLRAMDRRLWELAESAIVVGGSRLSEATISLPERP